VKAVKPLGDSQKDEFAKPRDQLTMKVDSGYELRPHSDRLSAEKASDSIAMYAGWGGRIRTCEWRHQKPLPYHLATPQQGGRI
jgi:hypothetical protein